MREMDLGQAIVDGTAHFAIRHCHLVRDFRGYVLERITLESKSGQSNRKEPDDAVLGVLALPA